MKKVIVLILINFICNAAFAQNFSELAAAKFESVASYKTAEEQVLTCANYLFDNPTNIAEVKRLNAIQYIIKWMEGTPDYTFELGKNVMELTKGKMDLMSLYMAAISKVVIENTGEALSSDEIYNRAEKILVEYCAVPENDIKPSKKIKQLLKEKKG